MITLVYGASGSGKSFELRRRIMADLAAGRKAMLIVPEQEAVEAESRITDDCIASGTPLTELEVLNFTRLADRVFRQYGGLAYNYIGKGARQIIMWRALASLTPVLGEYRDLSLSDKNALRMLLSATDEFSRYSVTPSMLGDASDALEDGETTKRLSAKLRDLSLIYSMYKNLLHAEYNDPEEDLPRLYHTLRKHDFFAGRSVYFDSFMSFTPVQSDIIALIAQQADECVFAIGLPPDISDSSAKIMFDSLIYTDKLIKRIASQNNISVNTVVLDEAKRFTNNEIPLLGRYLWDFSQNAGVYAVEPEHIKITSCPDIFAEAEACAREIVRRIQSGGRYFVNVVVMRDPSVYRGVIDAVFDRYDIPYFVSERADLTVKPPVKLILSAFSIICYRWQLDDIISYIKTGLTGIGPDECDLLEEYVSTWRISGSRWTDNIEWHMNPDGYTEVFTERGHSILYAVNDTRSRLVAPLVALEEKFKHGCTVRSGAEAVYNFIEAVGLREKIVASAEDEPVQLWNLLLDTLDQLVAVAGESLVTAEQFAQLLSIMFDEADIGSIPTAMDEVTIGNAMLLRAGKAKNVYIIGLNDGTFPQTVSDDGIFNDNEKVSLETCGITLSPATDRRASDELFYLYRAATCVSDNISFFYHTADSSGRIVKPSAAYERIRTLFPKLKLTIYGDISPFDGILTSESAFEYIAICRGTPLGDALREVYSKRGDYSHRLESLDLPFIDPRNNVSTEMAKKLFGGDLALTQSRLESYALCGFSYYCKYVLKLAERKRAEFKQVDIGNFTHRVLERFMQAVYTEEGLRSDIGDSEAESIIDGIITEYMDSVLYGSLRRTNRMMQLFRRLRRTSLLLIRGLLDEFSQSDFRPLYFELPIRFGDPEAIIPLKVGLNDGASAYVYGKVDRVDVYKKGRDVYVRVVDYKTGIKSFSLSDVELGLNMQMLLYLFAIWQNPSESFLSKSGCDNGNVLPAGVLYMSVRAPEVNASPGMQSEDILAAAESSLQRDGVLIDNPEILRAMDKQLSGRYIPVKLKKDGSFTAASTVQSLEQFGVLLNRVKSTVARIASELKRGQADAIPLRKVNGDSVCEYCPLKPICRSQ